MAEAEAEAEAADAASRDTEMEEDATQTEQEVHLTLMMLPGLLIEPKPKSTVAQKPILHTPKLQAKNAKLPTGVASLSVAC